MFRLISASAFILACSLVSGCADDPVAAPITDAPVSVSETFDGTLTVHGAAMHTFLTTVRGQAVATLRTLSPTGTVSFIFGTWNGSYCQVIFVKDDATTGTVFVGTASPGAFCVRVADVGGIAEPTTYSITVEHF